MTPNNLRPRTVSTRLRSVMILTAEKMDTLLTANQFREAADLSLVLERLAKADQSIREGCSTPLEGVKHAPEEGCSTKRGGRGGVSLSSEASTKASSTLVAPTLEGGKTLDLSTDKRRKAQPYDGDEDFMVNFVDRFPKNRRAGLPKAYRLWKAIPEADRWIPIEAIAEEVAEAEKKPTKNGTPGADYVANIVKWLEEKRWEAWKAVHVTP